MAKIINTHGYEKPTLAGRDNSETLSVSIFKWIEKKRTPGGAFNGLMKSSAIVRVRGFASNPQAIYDKADEIVKLLDEGKFVGQKTFVIK